MRKKVVSTIERFYLGTLLLSHSTILVTTPNRVNGEAGTITVPKCQQGNWHVFLKKMEPNYSSYYTTMEWIHEYADDTKVAPHFLGVIEAETYSAIGAFDAIHYWNTRWPAATSRSLSDARAMLYPSGAAFYSIRSHPQCKVLTSQNSDHEVDYFLIKLIGEGL
jgi:hypothetical protein